MTIFEAIILGAIQGITEFLPVSSSGHLVLVQKIFGMEEPVLLFDTMLHIGTLIAVCSVLWRDIWEILRKIIQPVTLYLIIATIPAVIAALLLKDHIEAAFATASLLGISFLITSGLLVFSELIHKRIAGAEFKKQMTWLDALIIGILQAVAIIPAISRSGATVSGGLFCGLNRDFAVRFSFLLSIPVIIGAFVFQLKDIDSSAVTDIVPMIAGTATAAVVGFFSIKLMLKIVREHTLAGFACYTGALGLLVLIDQFVTRIFF